MDWLAFMSGVVVTLVGAYVAHLLNEAAAKQRRLEQTHFEIYMALLEINQQHFWICSWEMHHEPFKSEVQNKISELKWKLADKLRTCDSSPFLERTLDALFSMRFTSHAERSRAMNSLIDDIAKVVNPRFTTISKTMSEENIHRIASSFDTPLEKIRLGSY